MLIHVAAAYEVSDGIFCNNFRGVPMSVSVVIERVFSQLQCQLYITVSIRSLGNVSVELYSCTLYKCQNRRYISTA